MADATVSTTADPTQSANDVHDHAHPTERQYWLVFVVLAVLTAIEVAWSYAGVSGPALVVPLVIMMVIKFALVAGIFMHLYFDLKIVNGKLFTWAFGAALVLAGAVYFVVIAAFDFRISGAF